MTKQTEDSFDYTSAIDDAVSEYKDRVVEMGTTIYSNPEMGFTEMTAHDTICTLFESLDDDYEVTRHAYKTPEMTTALQIEASVGDGSGRLVIFNAEYDALPVPIELKHACGHNLIATASVAGFIAAVQALRSAGSKAPKNWRLRLLGTPAEEYGGGKIKLIEQGAYVEADAAVMVHPFASIEEAPEVDGIAVVPVLASEKIDVTFEGQPSHAAATPWAGLNALDAFVNSYVSISTLRQQLSPDKRICGIITEGGTVPNVIPALVKAQYSVRAANKEDLADIVDKVEKCLEAGAMASGCTCTITRNDPYLDMRTNEPLKNLFISSIKGFGRTFMDVVDISGGSTDQGNVSYECPAIHPWFCIPTFSANHTEAFADAAALPESYERAFSCGKALAAIAVKVVADDEFAREVREYFEDTAGKKTAASTLLGASWACGS